MMFINLVVIQSSEMYLLDTYHCSRILQGHISLKKKLSEIDNLLIATCTVVCGELIFMAHKSQQKDSNLLLIKEFIQNIKVFPIDEPTAYIYGELKALLLKHFGPKEKTKRNGFKIEKLGLKENDLWIAAIAKY